MAPRLPGDVGVGPFGLLCVPMHNGFDDLDLDRLRRRRSEKWRLHPPDVLPAFIAEMDYDRAGPVVAALRTALDLGDCGYAALPDIGETFAAFAAARHGWTVDPGRVHLVPDVMAGFDAILALATERRPRPSTWPGSRARWRWPDRRPWSGCSRGCPNRATTAPGCSACWRRWPRGVRERTGWTRC